MIKDDALSSTPWWPPRVVPPKGAPQRAAHHDRRRRKKPKPVANKSANRRKSRPGNQTHSDQSQTMKTNKTNILRGALSSIVAFTIVASAAASQAATP